MKPSDSMPTDRYTETIQWLFSRFPSYQSIGAPAYKPGLENTLLLAEMFGNPQNDLKFIHVGGSNGKGSICSMLASIYKESGLKTGLFTSPHLVDFRERIRINGQEIDQTFVVEFCDQIKQLQLPFAPSFFEITWVMALVYFKHIQCDVVIAEVGLGGRLDSTNILSPLISVISNISLEHTEFLGTTISAIASEKGGIIKPGIPLITSETKQEALDQFHRIAEEKHTVVIQTKPTVLPGDFPLLGDYQAANFACVQKVVESLNPVFPVDDVAVEHGLQNLTQNTGFKARLQVIQNQPWVIYDVSHNADGIEKTLDTLKKHVPDKKLFLVYGSSKDKNFDEIFPLFPKNAQLFLTEFSSERSASIEKLKEFAEKNELVATFFKTPLAALEKAKELASIEDTILVFGSFFLIHDLLK